MNMPTVADVHFANDASQSVTYLERIATIILMHRQPGASLDRWAPLWLLITHLLLSGFSKLRNQLSQQGTKFILLFINNALSA